MARVALMGAAAVLGIGLGSVVGAANAPISLQWRDLMPASERIDGVVEQALQGVVQHGEITASDEPQQTALVTEYNGEQVRIPGYVLPLEFDATEVREFLLVPYVGACIHVPPPPANQIVYVTSEDGIPVTGMFDPVWVTGTMNTASISNELADIGYQIEADLVEPYE
ncbi:MAG: DUF3299 domain-containing protein [Pseudomonadota bacterium]